MKTAKIIQGSSNKYSYLEYGTILLPNFIETTIISLNGIHHKSKGLFTPMWCIDTDRATSFCHDKSIHTKTIYIFCTRLTIYSIKMPFEAFEISRFWKYYGKWSNDFHTVSCYKTTAYSFEKKQYAAHCLISNAEIYSVTILCVVFQCIN